MTDMTDRQILPLLELLTEPEICDNPTHLALVQLGHCPQQMECPDVPHLGVGDNFQSYDWSTVRLEASDWPVPTVRMKHSTETLVELVKFVQLSRASRVPEYSV